MNINEDEAILIIHDFLNTSDKDIKKFCLNKKIDTKTFYKYMEYFKKKAPNLYKEYLQEQIDDVNTYTEEVQKYMDVVSKILNDKKYQYLDYRLACNMNTAKFFSEVKDKCKLSQSDLKKIYDFCKKYNHNDLFKPTNLLQEKYYIIQNDEKREIIEEEKLQVLSTMHDFSLPNEIILYRQLTKRILSGKFTSYEKNEIKK